MLAKLLESRHIRTRGYVHVGTLLLSGKKSGNNSRGLGTSLATNQSEIRPFKQAALEPKNPTTGVLRWQVDFLLGQRKIMLLVGGAGLPKVNSRF